MGTSLARDRANQLLREPDKVAQEIEQRLRADLTQRGDFERVVVMPASGVDVPDEVETRLVVLGPDHAYSKAAGNAAEVAAKSVLESRGNAPRLFRNTLVFAAPDVARLQDLEQAVRDFLAWQSIVNQKTELNLTPHQATQAQTQLRTSESTVLARLPETYQWALVPEQATPQAAVTWNALKLSGNDALALRVAKKLKSDELLFTSLGGTRLRMALDDVPLWRGEHVSIKQLTQDFASYLYLPRLARPRVLSDSARVGISLLTWEQDSFAYAEAFDADKQRYLGLQCSMDLLLTPDDAGLLVKPAAARAQQVRETPPSPTPGGGTPPPPSGGGTPPPPPTPASTRPKSYHGVVTLNAERLGRDAGQVATEVISHLTGLIGADVKVTIEIHAQVPDGVPENVVRIVTENGKSLKFEPGSGFEEE